MSQDKKLHPGIEGIVRYLQANEFKIVESGDGGPHFLDLGESWENMPMVRMVCPAEQLVWQTDKVSNILLAQGIDYIQIEGHYYCNPSTNPNRNANILVYGEKLRNFKERKG